MATFASDWFHIDRSDMGIKRESGANPGQSRCCEAPIQTSWKDLLPLIDGDRLGRPPGWESVRRPATH